MASQYTKDITKLKVKKETIKREMISIPPGFIWDENSKKVF